MPSDPQREKGQGKTKGKGPWKGAGKGQAGKQWSHEDSKDFLSKRRISGETGPKEEATM